MIGFPACATIRLNFFQPCTICKTAGELWKPIGPFLYVSKGTSCLQPEELLASPLGTERLYIFHMSCGAGTSILLRGCQSIPTQAHSSKLRQNTGQLHSTSLLRNTTLRSCCPNSVKISLKQKHVYSRSLSPLEGLQSG